MTKAQMLKYADENGVEGVSSSMKRLKFSQFWKELAHMTYADYDYYSGTYLGTVSEEDFPRLAVRASSFLDYYTQNRAKITLIWTL